MKKLLRVIDAIGEYQGQVGIWFAIMLVLTICYDVIMRYAFSAPTNWAFETAIMVGGSLYALGWGYTHHHRGHIRIDIFYTRLSPRGKAIVDIVGDVILFFPLLALFLYVSFSTAVKAWVINEKSTLTFWYPPVAPFRTLILLGFCLLTLQVISQFIRDLYLLLKGRAYD